LTQCLIGLQAFKPLIIFNIVSSPTTIAYLPTALGASKTTLLLSNNVTGGPYAWQLPQCTITSNPYGGATGTFGLYSCILANYGAISAVVWFYEPPGGQGAILGYSNSQYPSSPSNYAPWLYVGTNGYCYVGECFSSAGCHVVYTPSAISPGWHIAIVEEWITPSNEYLALYLDGQFIGQYSTTYSSNNLPQIIAANIPYADIGTGHTNGWPATPGGWYFFNGNIALVALYNSVLTTGDVLAIYQGNLVTSGLVAVWYGDDYNPSNGYWVSRVGGYTGAPITSSYPPRGCLLWPVGNAGIYSNWPTC